MAKDYIVHLKCPYGDDDQLVVLQDRKETLSQILTMPVDFECPVHGVQREIPLEASERQGGRTPVVEPQAPAPPQPAVSAAPKQRSSKRISLHVQVLVYGWTKGESAFHEETTTLLVNASGGLVALATKVGLGDTVYMVNKATQEEQECRVAYVGPELEGKLRVGVAFRRQAPSFWRNDRQDYRIAKSIRVQVRGNDRNGHPFVQSAFAIDISRNGARLDGVGYLTWPGEIIEIKRGWSKARFRVVWVGEMGTPQVNQVGVCCLEPEKYIWGVRLPYAGEPLR